MDMLLEEKKFENCYTTGKKGETDIMINSLNKNTVLVDWQYNKALKAPIPSLDSLKHCENKVMGAPWQTEANYTAHIDTIIQNNYFGIMMTTWHTLSTNMPDILGCAEKCGAKLYTWGEYANLHTKTATLMRAISFVKKEYRDCGWSKNGTMAQ